MKPYPNEELERMSKREIIRLYKRTVEQFNDAVPVRHGKWAVEWETDDTRMLRCSECRMVFNVGKGRDGNYCPNCGARMDGERREE